MAKLFTNVSLEAIEGNTELQNATDNVVNDVLTDDAKAEAIAAKNSIDGYNTTIVQAEESIATLAEELVKTEPTEEDTELSEEALAFDTKKKAIIVNEALKRISTRLGIDPSSAVSTETLLVSPRATLTLAREGISEFIEKIIRAIREFFQKVWAKLKVYAANVVIYFSKFNERIKQIRAMIKAPDDLKVNVYQDDVSILAPKLMNKVPGTDITFVVENLLRTMESNARAVDTLVNGHRNLVSKYLTEISEYLKDKPIIGRFIAKHATEAGFLNKFEEEHFGIKDVKNWYDLPKEKYIGVHLLRYNGTALLVTNDEDRFRVSKTTLALSQSTMKSLEKGCRTYLTLNECVKYLNQLETLTKRIKQDNDNIITKYNAAIKNNDDMMADFKKKIDTGVIKEGTAQKQLADLRQMNLIAILTLPELLFDRIDNFKNILFIITKSIQGHQRFDYERSEQGKERPRVETNLEKMKHRVSNFMGDVKDKIDDIF